MSSPPPRDRLFPAAALLVTVAVGGFGVWYQRQLGRLADREAGLDRLAARVAEAAVAPEVEAMGPAARRAAGRLRRVEAEARVRAAAGR